MRLSELAAELAPELTVRHRGADVLVAGVRRDSRRIAPGELFVAIPGARVDGASFAEAALAQGAAALLVERELSLPVPQLIVSDARRALALAAHAVYGRPTEALEVVGITGTNGKTTTAWLVDAMLSGLGARSALLGTVARRADSSAAPAAFTTPEADDLVRFARSAVDGGATHLVMEVSSHGLVLERVRGVRFRVAVFTNLSQDHLDFHGDMGAYGEAKARLFFEHRPAAAVIHVDDPFGAELAPRLGPSTVRVSLRDPSADVWLGAARSDREGVSARARVGGQEVELRSPLVGRHNLENLAVALGVAKALDLDVGEAASALAEAPGAPGRLERVPDPRGVAVLVDYAHTPDALANALGALRPLTPGRLVVVFGCGGDRDRDKRPKMGRVAAEGADVVVVTSDNPRTESPHAIVEGIVAGVEAAGMRRARELAEGGFVVELDRREAIEKAVRAARAGDTVLIAGKGHEDYQIVGTERRAFDDRRVAAEVIAALGEEG